MSITVYTKPECNNCDQTKRRLNKHGIEYTTVDVTEDAAAREFVTDGLGYRQMPVVVVDENTHWSGFRIDALDKLAAA
ncbi:glutaredoxin family protein [Rhodococcus sp. 15-725-2-2b]|uniref:glutaredoxin family protein n=1 Tax=unclassified Rhodococcus (in: high G+C Gram-positive bacteria) TaxID=192944 RepID=UPI0007BC37C0|nr:MULTISPECIES: glutaredoxin family protein [unclassified Rhodococcus (in: high G+C Gram-positive bacteria)]MDZ7931820.1 glutaredoxin family protein [Rhodococcus sp. (in: high G+C Gram-positive bacteria)]KZF06233.1 NrdH-redoxin [Rhodococcus sp. EPR-147]KZF08961.1 NrdH-redoxin [Rhodococcus sp. EPR-279]OZC63583.1 glutaredoxin family protein [Rhodococcus sp. 06-469-3-2]OZD40748.1 glutaredoxin family protein [Rhodococcus sp. 06-1477-1A]